MRIPRRTLRSKVLPRKTERITVWKVPGVVGQKRHEGNNPPKRPQLQEHLRLAQARQGQNLTLWCRRPAGRNAGARAGEDAGRGAGATACGGSGTTASSGG